MVKKVRQALLLASLLGAACQPHPSEADTFQGVIEYQERDLAFEITGRITELAVKEGDRLAAGALIARIAPDLAQSTLEAREGEARAAGQELALLRAGARPEDVRALQARVDAARAGEALMRTNAERTRQLVAAQASPRAALDDANAQLLRAQADTRAAVEALKAAQSGARAPEIRAARDCLEAAQASSAVERARTARHELHTLDPGEVLQVELRPGELAVSGAPVVTVADTAHPYADVFVAEGAIGGIQIGAPARARVDSLEHDLAGRVERISRRTEFSPRYLFSRTDRAKLVIRVRVRFDDAARALHAGVPVFVRIDRTAPAVAPSGAGGAPS